MQCLATEPLIASPKLVEVQIMALSATYLEGTTASSSAWLINGVGVRWAEDVGAHREKVYAATHTFENQMWKRAFWCLVQKDREISVGALNQMRSCAGDGVNVLPFTRRTWSSYVHSR